MVGRNNFKGYGLGVRRVLGAVQSRVQAEDKRLYICREHFTDRLTICRPDRQGHAIAFLVLNFGEASQCEEENR